ncbi:putative ATPase [Coemansia sp. RSA 1939]|nr:putative ATPase [Coemansia sp. RSA 1939]KAJ2614556.1 putative ATPase [Coemansia sp. RSA 1804]
MPEKTTADAAAAVAASEADAAGEGSGPNPNPSQKGVLRGLREKALAQYEEPNNNNSNSSTTNSNNAASSISSEAAARQQRLEFLLEKSAAYASFVARRLESKREEKRGGPRRKRAKLEIADGSKESEEGDNDENDDDDGDAERVIDGERVSHRQPRSITGGVMREYQLEGMEWLASLYENGLNGILADEMGLGKTLQTIAFLAFLRERKVWGPFLVVVPLSTLANWASEFFRFSPDTPVLVYHGTPDERRALRAKHLRRLDRAFPVVVTTYEVAMRDRQALQRFAWKFIVVDEGHRIKNMNCRLVRELKAYQSANRLLLTGTPLQNSLAELWSLLNFLLPDIFDDLDSFQQWFDLDGIGQSQSGDQNQGQDQNADLNHVPVQGPARVVAKLHQILQPFLLRRLKTDVEKLLPPKREYLISCPMAPLQFEYYQAVRGPDLHGFLASRASAEAAADAEAAEAASSASSSASVSASASASASKVRHMNLNFRLMQQRKVCQHPYLFDFPVVDPADPESALRVDEELVRGSGKLLVLDRLLPELFAQGHRVLIFSQFARVLDVLECYAELRSWAFCRIDGSVAQAERQEAIVRFNTHREIPLFFLTTRSGGLGINLTSADTVVLFDSDWNPQQDLQAQDRVHRIGQKAPVIVYRLAIAGSCETAMIRRARDKRRLEKLVIHERRFKGLARRAATAAGASGAGAADEVSESDVARILASDDSELVARDQMAVGRVLAELEPGARVPDDAILSADEVRLLTDRSPAAYCAGGSGAGARFEELALVADEQNDILAATATV